MCPVSELSLDSQTCSTVYLGRAFDRLDVDEEMRLLIERPHQNHRDRALDDVAARVVVEAANGPITASASQRLESGDVTVVPDVFANAGRRDRLLLRVGAESPALGVVSGASSR